MSRREEEEEEVNAEYMAAIARAQKEEEEEELLLTFNAKSHEGERRKMKKDAPETIVIRSGDTTMVETPGITLQSSGTKVDQTCSAAAAPIAPPCTGEAENDGTLMMDVQDEDGERSNQGDNNVHTMSRDEYLEVARKMKSMGERLKAAAANEAKQLAVLNETIAAKDAMMMARAADWEDQQKMNHILQLQRDNEMMQKMLEVKSNNGESKTRYKPTKPAVFKDDSSIMAWQQLKTIETYAIRANLEPSSFMGVLYDHLGPSEQTWLQGIVQTYAWTMEKCTEAQWKKVKDMFTEKFAGSRIARETAVTGARQARSERMGTYLTRFRLLSDQAGMNDEPMMVARAVHGIYGSIKGNFAALAVRTDWASFTLEAEGIYEVLVPRGKLPPLTVGSGGVHAVCEEVADEEVEPTPNATVAGVSMEQLQKALSSVMNGQGGEPDMEEDEVMAAKRCAGSARSQDIAAVNALK